MAIRLRSYGIYFQNRGAVFEPALLGSDPRLRVKVVLAGRTRAEMPRHAPHYFLRPPAVLDTRPAIQTQVYVVSQATLRAVEQRKTKSYLRPPAAAAAFVATPIRVRLARIRPPRTQSDLRPPTVLQTFSGPSVHTTRIRPPAVHPNLQPPAVVTAPFIAPPIATHLVAVSSRAERSRHERHMGWEPGITDVARSYSALDVAPGVLSGDFKDLDDSADRAAQSFVAQGTALHGVRWRLEQSGTPTDDVIIELQSNSVNQPSNTVLASASIPGTVGAQGTKTLPLSAPLTPGTAYWLVLRRSGSTDAVNFVRTWGGAEFQFDLDIAQGKHAESNNSGTNWAVNPVRPDSIFAYSEQMQQWGARRVFIGVWPPQIIDEKPIARPIKTSLATIAGQTASLQRRQPYSFLRPPAVLQVFSGPDVYLTRIRPPKTEAALRPPTVLRVFDAAQTYLTRIRPPKTRSFLRPPAVVAAAPASQDQQTIQTWLVRIRPPKTASELRAPSTLEPASLQLRNRTIRVDLARIRPPKVRYFLRPPVVVGRFVEDQIRTVLAPSARRRGKGVLRPPTVLRVFTAARVYLTRIRPRKTQTELRPPTRLAPVETQIRVHLAPSRRGRPTTEIRPPAVVAPARIYDAPQTPPVRIRPPRTHSVLRPPATLVPFIATPVAVTLVQIRPPAVRYILRDFAPAFIPPKGKVCGFDSTSTAVCYGDIVTQIECGFDSTPTRAVGSSSTRSRISGQTGSRTRTVGRDEEAT